MNFHLNDGDTFGHVEVRLNCSDSGARGSVGGPGAEVAPALLLNRDTFLRMAEPQTPPQRAFVTTILLNVGAQLRFLGAQPTLIPPCSPLQQRHRRLDDHAVISSEIMPSRTAPEQPLSLHSALHFHYIWCHTVAQLARPVTTL